MGKRQSPIPTGFGQFFLLPVGFFRYHPSSRSQKASCSCGFGSKRNLQQEPQVAVGSIFPFPNWIFFGYSVFLIHSLVIPLFGVSLFCMVLCHVWGRLNVCTGEPEWAGPGGGSLALEKRRFSG